MKTGIYNEANTLQYEITELLYDHKFICTRHLSTFKMTSPHSRKPFNSHNNKISLELTKIPKVCLKEVTLPLCDAI